MNLSIEIIGLVVGAIATILGGTWAIYRFIRGLDKRAALKEQEVSETKAAERMKAIEHAQEDAKTQHAKDLDSMEAKSRLEHDKIILRLDYLEKQVDSLSARQGSDYEKHDQIIDDLREVLADIRETIAGFGKDFVTRREFLDKEKKRGS